jgi:predicted ATPase/class 3 adenylate cyclase/DNA-binding CsgD family transcriptional regulator
VVEFAKPLMWGEPKELSERPPSGFQLPAGTVTFLLSDIEGSTRLWETHPDEMPAAVADTYAILDEAVACHGGVRPLEQGEGDSIVAAFSRAADAVAAALAAQRSLHAHAWPEGVDLGVRIALHTADAQLRDDANYFGVALSRCARLRAVARGAQTVLSHATHDLVVDRLPDQLELVDCGTHRLRDLGRPEHVYAFAHPDLPSDLGPLRSLDAFPNNLPDQLTSFVGRARELDEVRTALGETRLLALTGAGGAGKTRLALQAAADALDSFPDGAWWAELAPLSEPEHVGEALAAALGVRPLPGKTALDATCTQLAERRALVVLDNCEHLVAACAEAADELLRRCPAVTVIATSRTPLGLAGETDWRVPSLSLPNGQPKRDSIAALSTSDAVRLFIERARKARPNFAVTNETAPAVAQICQELDGLPLAIELAAARVRMLAVEQIAAGLSDRFHLLTGGVRTAFPRHQTLRACVDWSHELLSADERTLFARLSVFSGGFTLDACEAVGAGDGLERFAILDLLGALVDRSLVVAEDRGPAVRYRLLETVRQYAAERLAESDEQGAVQGRHSAAFLALAEAVEPALEGAGQRGALELLDPEAGNFGAAFDWAVETDGEEALRLCKALSYWWRLRGMFAAGQRTFERALEAGQQAAAPLRAYVMVDQAYLALFAGRYEEAFHGVEAAAALAEEVGDARTLGRALCTRALITMSVDPVGSRDSFERAAELSRSAGDDWNVRVSRLSLALTHAYCDEFEEADRLHEEVLSDAESLGSHEILAWIWVLRSEERLNRADLGRAVEFAERGIAHAVDVGDLVTEGYGHAVIALADLFQGRPGPALDRLEGVRARMVAAGAGMAIPFVDTCLGPILVATGDLDRARSILEDVIASGADFGRTLAWAGVELGDVLRVAGDAVGAANRAREALEVAQRLPAPGLIARANEILGRLAAERGEWAEAEGLLHEALAARVERGLQSEVPRALDALAELSAGLGSDEEAARILGAVERAYADFDMVRWGPDAARVDALGQALAERLGQEAYEAAHAEGGRLDLDEVIAWLRRARGERKRPARGWESLTPTEAKVVELLAEGLTNPQIGERMFISRGTVKVHVSHVFAKLGISTRAELAAEAVRRGRTGHP